MADYFPKPDMSDFLDMMKLPNGTPLIPGNMIDWLAANGWFSAPASTKYHGNHEGGLLEHSAAVMEFLVQLTKDNALSWKNPRSPYIVGMFHDLCKIDQYIPNHCDGVYHRDPISWDYNPNTLLKGHGDKSVMLLSQFYTLTEEEIMCIRYHMGAFTDKSKWNDYTRAVRLYPNVLWTHQADMLASHVLGV